MPFFINDKAGIAYEDVEGGIAKWSSKDKDFTILMSSEERRMFAFPARRVSADEAFDLMLAKDAATEASESR